MPTEPLFIPPSLEALPCGLLVTDPEGRILWCNTTLAGWRGGPGLRVGDAWAALLPRSHADEYGGEWLSRRLATGPLTEVRLELGVADRPCMPVVMSASRRSTQAGDLFDLVFQPDSQRLADAQELNESRDELRLLVHEATRLEAEAHDRALFAEQMVGIVSHDLRNPLQAIHMGVLALTRGTLTTNQIRVLGRVSRSTERAHRLIADLLDFTAARMGAGLTISPQRVDLGHLLSEAVEELTLAFPGRELLYRSNGEEACTIDPDRLSQLVGNLVANAMTYGDPLRAVTVASESGDGETLVSVHNWGQPIPADRIEQIFEPMVRGEAKGQSRSVGLGLYIVCEIVKAHGGTMDVRSEPASGTTFTASFPAA